MALVVLGPLLRPGYILTLDMAFTPVLHMPDHVDSTYLFFAMLHWLNIILPSDFLQKLLLGGILLLAGLGGHRLAGWFKTGQWACYAAGVLYMVNPFVYGRLMTGQYLVLFGYALLPWFVAAMLRLLARPAKATALMTAAWAVAVGCVSIHAIVPMLLCGGLLLAARLWQLRRDSAASLRIIKYGALAMAAWLAVNSYWLLPLAFGKGITAQTVGSFTAGDQLAFATNGSTLLERLLNVLSLQGFWAEGRGLFIMPQDSIPGWAGLMLVLWAVVVTGALAMWRRQRGIAAVFISCIVIGALLAAGTGGQWMARHIPFYAGYREPQKFAMLIALGYAVFAAFGVDLILRRLGQWDRWKPAVGAAGVIFAALPFLITPTIVWAANGQLRAAGYPAGWYQANRKLNQDGGDFQVLFLPWHLYIDASFAGRIIANPAVNFFDKPVVISDDPELKGVSLARSSPLKRDISQALAQAPKTDNQLGDELAELNVKYIILATTSDYERYGYLDRQSNLKLVGNYDGMKMYRNQAYIERK